MIVFSPSDWVLAQKFVDYSINVKKPKYLRFDGKPIPRIYENADAITFEDGFTEIFQGEKICLVTTGYMTNKAMHIAKKLADNNILIGIIDVYLLKPFNEELFSEKIENYTQVITLEEAFINKGGLDGLISKILDSKNSDIRLKRMGFEDAYVFDIGSREYLHTLNNLDEVSITKNVTGLIAKN
jgi:transketolase